MNGKKMNNRQSLYLLWATILNQSQSAETVLKNTFELFKRLNLLSNFDKEYKNLNYENIEKVKIYRVACCLNGPGHTESSVVALALILLEHHYRWRFESPTETYKGKSVCELKWFSEVLKAMELIRENIVFKD